MTHKLNLAANGRWFVLLGPYDEALVSRLKAAVPPEAREWRPTAKCWRIGLEYGDIVQRLLKSIEKSRRG